MEEKKWNVEEKLFAFKEPLSYIKDEAVEKFAEKGISILPNYFFEIPASSTGKYHPAYSLGEGGLLRHTIAAVRIAVELSRMDMWKMSDLEFDLVIASLILHDGWKSGEFQGNFTVAEHPEVAVAVLSKDKELMSIIPKEQTDIIFGNIATHMGQWNTTFRGKKEILRKPSKKIEKFTHLCDYLASRKCLEMNFEVGLSK